MNASDSKIAYRTGRRAMATGRYSAARSAFRWAVGLDPKNPIYTHAAAMAADRAGWRDEAEELYRRALADTAAALGESHPHLVTVAHGLVELLERRGRIEEARALAVDIVARIDPAMAETANSRVLERFAALCRRADALAPALALYRRAIGLRCRLHGNWNPMISGYLAGLARLHQQMGHYARARAVRRRLARLAGMPDRLVDSAAPVPA